MLRKFLPMVVAVGSVALTGSMAMAVPAGALLPAVQMSTQPNVPILYPVGGLLFGVEMRNLEISNPTSQTQVTPTTPTFQINSFFDVFTELSVDGGTSWQPAFGTQDVHDQSTGTNDGTSNGTTTFDTEMTQLDIGPLSTAGGLLLIRESPTLQSTGQTKLTNNGDGTFRIDSFFDVFTELSIDGGQTWTPATGSARLADSPEPGTVGLLAVGGVAMLRRRRRR